MPDRSLPLGFSCIVLRVNDSWKVLPYLVQLELWATKLNCTFDEVEV